MKKFKIIDFCISALLIVSFLVKIFIDVSSDDLLGDMFLFYLLVGGWQSISMIVHLATKTFTYKESLRNWYHVATLLVLLSMPLSLIIIMFLSPIMAVFYTILCYDETFRKMKRSLSILK